MFNNLKNILDKRIGSRDLIKFEQSFVIYKKISISND